MVDSLAWFVLDIFFWVLGASAVLAFGTYVYIYLMYYKWEKEEKTNNDLVEKLSTRIVEEYLDYLENEENK